MRASWLLLLIVGAMAATPACSCSRHNDTGGDDLASGGGDDLSVAMVVPSTDGGCTTSGLACGSSAECCSGNCDPTMHVCGLAQCAGAGAPCQQSSDCCSLSCTSGACSAQCVSDNQPCSAGGSGCCSTRCVNGSCAPLNSGCKTAGNACTMDLDCCSGKCDPRTMTCAAPSTVSYCTQPGDICFHDNECCTGVCAIASGSNVGTCANITTSCKVDGLVCNGCSTSPRCCSSFCAPFGSAGSTVCQPASGCHVLGDLCLSNADCCGGDAMNGLPGSGLVICVPDPMYPQIGTCSMANTTNCTGEPTCKNSCQPEGDVCHYLGNGACSSNAFPNDCCAAPGNKGECKLDKAGVPRCYGLGMCVMPGGACASAADCCNGLPCVPDSTGHLVCGSMSCVPPGGVCTTTGDCCTGYACIVPPGSTTGTCVNPTPTPAGDMGSGGADLLPPSCALAGQACSSSVPCCQNEGNCVGPTYAACTAGETDCSCLLPIL